MKGDLVSALGMLNGAQTPRLLGQDHADYMDQLMDTRYGNAQGDAKGR